MSERQGGAGNTDAPKVDTDYGERSTGVKNPFPSASSRRRNANTE